MDKKERDDAVIHALREALSLTPGNIILRRHLAGQLLQMDRYAEAEFEYRQALNFAPMDEELKYGLAETYFRQDKAAVALVILEELLKGREPAARVWLLAARAAFSTGDSQSAAQYYARAVALDAALADPEWAAQLPPAQPEMPASLLPSAGSGEKPASTKDMAFVTVEGDSSMTVELERPKVTFSDVGGMEKVKEEIRMKIIYPLNHPEFYKLYGKTIGGGILMYGPPGCGKTHLARATAGEVKATFISVGLHDILDMWLGKSEQNLHRIFELARRNTPCVLFFDEVDALGSNRADLRQSAIRHTINQFLSELDGVDTSNEGVLILAATNAPWYMDPAMRRPGRFDRLIFVPPPDVQARAVILSLMLYGKPTERIDYHRLAQETAAFSGADLKGLVDVAVEDKLREAMQHGKPIPLTTRDLETALKRVKPTTLEWFASARNYAVYSNEGGQYDDIMEYLKHPERPGLFRNFGG